MLEVNTTLKLLHLDKHINPINAVVARVLLKTFTDYNDTVHVIFDEDYDGNDDDDDAEDDDDQGIN